MPIRCASARSRRVSSASTRSTRSNTSTARRPMSSSFPIGSDTTKSAPVAGSRPSARIVTCSSRSDEREPRRRARGRASPRSSTRRTRSCARAGPAPRRNTSDESPRKNGLIVAVNASRTPSHSSVTSTRPRSASSARSSCVARDTEHARRAPGDVGVARELERLVVRGGDVGMAAAHELDRRRARPVGSPHHPGLGVGHRRQSSGAPRHLRGASPV